jgi:flagellar basal body-associated protein FliL
MMSDKPSPTVGEKKFAWVVLAVLVVGLSWAVYGAVSRGIEVFGRHGDISPGWLGIWDVFSLIFVVFGGIALAVFLIIFGIVLIGGLGEWIHWALTTEAAKPEEESDEADWR